MRVPVGRASVPARPVQGYRARAPSFAPSASFQDTFASPRSFSTRTQSHPRRRRPAQAAGAPPNSLPLAALGEGLHSTTLRRHHERRRVARRRQRHHRWVPTAHTTRACGRYAGAARCRAPPPRFLSHARRRAATDLTRLWRGHPGSHRRCPRLTAGPLPSPGRAGLPRAHAARALSLPAPPPTSHRRRHRPLDGRGACAV
jgi:hypothetical protein